MSRPQHQPNAAPSSVPEADALSSNGATAPLSPTPGGDVEVPKFASASIAGELGRLGKYRIQRELGRGGMGAVYLAFDERLQRKVALKVMLPKAAANTSAKERFLREARAAAQISSDHVVNIYEADEIDGIPYIALQYLQGYPLDEYLTKHGTPSIPQIIRIGQETALGLEAAHQLGLVHRDIKPGNLWLEAPNGRVKILDFGLARQQTESVQLTHSGAVVGTPAYMSPEQGRGLAVDGRSDLFSLGGVLYRLCTGRLPFKGDSMMALLMAIGIDEPTPVRELNPSVPEPLANLIHRLLAKDPAHRPASGKAVADELNAINFAAGQTAGGQLPVVYLPMTIAVQESNPFEGITEFGSVSDETAASSPADSAPADEQVRRYMPLVGSLLFALLVVAGAVFLLTNNGKKPDPDVAAKVLDTTDVPKGKPPTPQPAKDPDRIAAEYVLFLGGSVYLHDQETAIKVVGDLPKTPFRLKAYKGLDGNGRVSDAGLAAFKDCKNLTMLGFWQHQISDAGLANFKDCKQLTHIHLRDLTSVTDAGLANLKGCKDLGYIYLSGTPVGDEGMENFKDCKNLSILSLNITNVTDAGLAHFKNCTNLTEINLNDTKVGDKGLLHLKEMKSLGYIDLRASRVTAVGAAELAKALPQCKIEWNGGIYQPKKSLDRVAAEYVLSISGSVRVNDDSREIKTDAELPRDDFRLTNVVLRQNKQVDDTGLLVFKGCKHLTYLDLHETRVTDKGMANFQECKDLLYLSLGGTPVGDAGLANFKDCSNLLTIYLAGTKLTDMGLANFKDCTNLGYLHLVGTQITDTGLVHLKDCKKLQHLNLSRTRVGDVGLANFTGCKKLTLLDLGDTQVTDAGLVHFKECADLDGVYLPNTAVGDAGPACFKNSKGLKELRLDNTKVGDAGVRDLLDKTKLVSLTLQKTKVTPAGLDLLRKALPKCKIEYDGGAIEPKR